jgi:hypothetical protein
VKKHLINYVASLINVQGWSLDVATLVNLLLVLFTLVTIAVFQVVIYQREIKSIKSKKILLQARLERVVLLRTGLEKFLG